MRWLPAVYLLIGCCVSAIYPWDAFLMPDQSMRGGHGRDDVDHCINSLIELLYVSCVIRVHGWVVGFDI